MMDGDFLKVSDLRWDLTLLEFGILNPKLSGFVRAAFRYKYVFFRDMMDGNLKVSDLRWDLTLLEFGQDVSI